MIKPKIKLSLLFLFSVLILGSGFRCTCFKPKAVQELSKQINLVYWRAWDSPSDFSEVIQDYKKIHPNISIRVVKLRYEEFEKKLLESYADLKPPDIISLHYGWVQKYEQKKFIQPMPEKVTMVYQTEKTSLGIKKEILIELKTTPTITIPKLKIDFLDTVSKDVIINNKIYGLPLGMDTMVLFYNRDLLNKAHIALPPTNWQEFQEAVKKTTFFDENKKIIQAGAALGTADNINRSPEILMLLMKQNGATVIENNSVRFSSNITKDYNPGLEAIKFYTDFANPRKEVYTWNDEMPDSLKAFADGKLTFYFGYSYDIPLIKAYSKNAVNYGIAKMPQIQGGEESNMANYWVETVSSRTKNANEAWDFIHFIATRSNEVEKFLKKNGKPTALRSLISQQLENDKTNIFASQLLTSTTWYKGLDINSAEKHIKELINNVNAGQDPIMMINLATQKVQQSISRILE